MTVYKVSWYTNQYSPYAINSASGMTVKEHFKVFGSKDKAQAFMESVFNAAITLGIQDVNPVITEIEVEE